MVDAHIKRKRIRIWYAIIYGVANVPTLCFAVGNDATTTNAVWECVNGGQQENDSCG